MGTVENNRSGFWDNAKFFLILLVVIGHFLSEFDGVDYYWPRYLVSVIYTFHMPMFIFISGMFSKSVINGKRFRIERVFTFIILYSLYKIIQFFLFHAFSHDITFEYFWVDDLPWYLLTMAIWLCLTFLVKDVKPVLMICISIGIAFLSGFSNQVGDFLALARAINYWPIFLFGFYLNHEKVKDVISIKWIRILGIIGLIVFLFLVWKSHGEFAYHKPFFTGRNSYEAIAETWDNFHAFYRILYYPFIVGLGICVLSFIPRRRIPLISQWGSKTLQVYFLHRLVLNVLEFVGFYELILGAIGPEKYWTAALVLCAIAVTIVLSLKIWSRPFDWLMRQKYRFLFRQSE